MRAPSASILFVGYRRDAVLSAVELGYSVHVIHDGPIQSVALRRLAGFHEVDAASWALAAQEPADDWIDFARRAQPSAIVATVERSMVPAALLRAALGLQGLSLSEAISAHDKLYMKQAAVAAGLPCARFRSVEEGATPQGLAEELGFPLVLKARTLSGSRGQVIAQDWSDLPESVAPGLLAESFVHGSEMSVESVVCEGRILFSNITEYFIPGFANIVPSRIAPDHRRRVLAFNERVLRAFDVRQGIVHLELFDSADGFVFGELARRPPGGYIMRLLQMVYGFNAWRTFLELELQMAPSFDFNTIEKPRPAGVLVLHPGRGQIEAVEGLDLVRLLPGVQEVSLNVLPGDLISRREGLGEEVGHILVQADSGDELVECLLRAQAALRIELFKTRAQGQ